MGWGAWTVDVDPAQPFPGSVPGHFQCMCLDVVGASLCVPPVHQHHVCACICVMGHGREDTNKARTAYTAGTYLVASFFGRSEGLPTP